MLRSLTLWLLVIISSCLFAWRAKPYVGPLLSAPETDRSDRVGERLAGVFEAVGLHRRLLMRPLSGALHALIFASFVALLAAIVQDFGSGLFPGFSIAPAGGGTWIGLFQDVFATLMVVGVGMAAYQRYVVRPSRFQGSNASDASIIYVLILAIVVAMLLEAAFAILGGAPSAWRPVAGTLASALSGFGLPALTMQSVFYWAHIGAILAFLVYIPGSKHRHMFLAAPNVFFRSLRPKGQTDDIPSERETPGIERIDQFDWKQKLDLLSCTECGRCQDACPAYASGLPLSPKTLIMDLRDAMACPSGGVALLGGVIKEDTLWACTTCRACMEVCPVEIEHLPKIVDMRRQLVDQGAITPGLQSAFSNLSRSGNSMGKPSRMRAKWTKDLPFEIADARSRPVDWLWFVGDYASFDPRAQEVTKKVAILLHAAGVDFGILFEAERNSGNDVRRAGEEGLFETLAQSNIDAIRACTFNHIVTTDPHSLNALNNEYRRFGTGFEARHYTALLAELIGAGKLTLAPATGGRVTYHDPCYLGRYNNGFDAPRKLIAAAGYTLHDMPRCRENSFCCGAGGGRIWQGDEGVVERPSENRIREALALGDVELFVVACPKDKVMYAAAVDALGVGETIRVVDVAELLALPADRASRSGSPTLEGAAPRSRSLH